MTRFESVYIPADMVTVYYPHGRDGRVVVRPSAIIDQHAIVGWRCKVTLAVKGAAFEYTWDAANHAHAKRLSERVAKLLAEVPDTELRQFLDNLELD